MKFCQLRRQVSKTLKSKQHFIPFSLHVPFSFLSFATVTASTRSQWRVVGDASTWACTYARMDGQSKNIMPPAPSIERVDLDLRLRCFRSC